MTAKTYRITMRGSAFLLEGVQLSFSHDGYIRRNTIESINRELAASGSACRIDDHHHARFACSRCGAWHLGKSHFCHICWDCSATKQTTLAHNTRNDALRAEMRAAKRAPATCRHCGQALTSSRSTKAYCSDACRQAAYRERRCDP
jgi:hypothetical protein